MWPFPRKQQAPPTLRCSRCGELHDSLSFAIPSRLPTYFFTLPSDTREERSDYNSDFCVIDGQRFFIYGSLELPIHGHDDPFIWGVWAEVTEEQFAAIEDSYGQEGREAAAPFETALASDLPIYPPCLGLKLAVRIQAVPTRPNFEIIEADHPLFAEQQRGVSPERIHEIRRWFESLRGERGVV